MLSTRKCSIVARFDWTISTSIYSTFVQKIIEAHNNTTSLSIVYL